jgi:flagellin
MRIGEITAQGTMFAHQLRSISLQLQLSQERVAKGTNLLRPSDGYGRFSTATLLRGQISGYEAGRAQAQDAHSLTSTLVDSLSGVRSILDEVRSLADSWNSGAGDKTEIHARVTQLGDQLRDQIADSKFGHISLLAGGAPVSFQIGPDAADSVSVNLPDATAMIGSAVSAFEAAVPGQTIDTNAIDGAIQNVDYEAGQASAVTSRMTHALSFADTQISALSKAEDRITDVDVASELAKQTALLIRQDAATAMLAQASQQQRKLVDLLFAR